MPTALLDQFAETVWVDWLGMITGIAGVWLSIKEKVLAWPLFISCYSCYVYIGYHSGLRGLMGMNIVFIVISLYGFWKWARNKDGAKDRLPITYTRKIHWPLIGLFLLLSTAAIGGWLGRGDEAKLPYLDALAASCGFVAQWMLSRKHIESWIFWILSDLIYLWIFFQGPIWPSVILFSVFIVLAIKGWSDWKPMIQPPD